jgi:hypothetical protein
MTLLVLTKDPSCVIAEWGVASLLMQKPIAGVGAPLQAAGRAQAAVDKARRIGAKPQRERDYVEAAVVYYQDFVLIKLPQETACRSGRSRAPIITGLLCIMFGFRPRSRPWVALSRNR